VVGVGGLNAGYGTAGGAVQCGALREGFVGGVVAVAGCSCRCAARPCLCQ
jgi:hypothetical protein